MAVGDIVRLPGRLIPGRTTQTATGDSVWIYASFPEYPFLISRQETFRFITYTLGGVPLNSFVGQMISIKSEECRDASSEF